MIQVMSILNLRCPLCAAVFVDFEACCAVTCAVRQLTGGACRSLHPRSA